MTVAAGQPSSPGNTRKPMPVELFNPPKSRPAEDPRWRPARPEGVSCVLDQSERTEKAIVTQCMNARVPGYKGHIPSAKAEAVFGRTEAHKGLAAAEEQARRRQQQQQRQEAQENEPQVRVDAAGGAWARAARGDFQGGATLGSFSIEGPGSGVQERRTTDSLIPSEHPLGGSRAELVRGHWVPTIPGYAGHKPGHHPEPICGGGVMRSCQMAGRAIAERGVYKAASPPEEERARAVAVVREHCASVIPGYSGHVPRIDSEQIYGARARAANLLAAEMYEEGHPNASFAPPPVVKPKLRL